MQVCQDYLKDSLLRSPPKWSQARSHRMYPSRVLLNSLRGLKWILLQHSTAEELNWKHGHVVHFLQTCSLWSRMAVGQADLSHSNGTGEAVPWEYSGKMWHISKWETHWIPGGSEPAEGWFMKTWPALNLKKPTCVIAGNQHWGRSWPIKSGEEFHSCT